MIRARCLANVVLPEQVGPPIPARKSRGDEADDEAVEGGTEEVEAISSGRWKVTEPSVALYWSPGRCEESGRGKTRVRTISKMSFSDRFARRLDQIERYWT